jgi:hypothetical protein
MADSVEAQTQPKTLPIADRALRMWLEGKDIEDGKPILVQFEFRDHLPGATYRGVPLSGDAL